MTVAEAVAALAAANGVDGSDDYAAWLSVQVSRIAGIDGDRTLHLIADLMREGVVSVPEAHDFTLLHVRETADDPR